VSRILKDAELEQYSLSYLIPTRNSPACCVIQNVEMVMNPLDAVFVVDKVVHPDLATMEPPLA
jgi:hypothetical protein